MSRRRNIAWQILARSISSLYQFDLTFTTITQGGICMSEFVYFSGFKYSDALAFKEGVTRRDPSPVIQVDGTYYVWYSRTEVVSIICY
jgi:hypothetical protein